MKANQDKLKNLYLRTSGEIASHLEMMAQKWNLTKNGYINKILREDFEREISSSTDFLKHVHQKIRG